MEEISPPPTPPLPQPRFVQISSPMPRMGEPAVPLTYQSRSFDTKSAGFQEWNSFDQFQSNRGQRSSSAASSLHSESSSTSKASQRSWEEDDVFDQVLQSISRELGNSTSTLKTKSVSRFAKRWTKTGRSQGDMQRALRKELNEFQKQVEAHYGISGQKLHTEAVFISGEYKECRGKFRELPERGK